MLLSRDLACWLGLEPSACANKEQRPVDRSVVCVKHCIYQVAPLVVTMQFEGVRDADMDAESIARSNGSRALFLHDLPTLWGASRLWRLHLAVLLESSSV